MLEPLGQSQVLAYLERLAPDRRIHLISFEKPADWADRDAAPRRRRTHRRGGHSLAPVHATTKPDGAGDRLTTSPSGPPRRSRWRCAIA